MYFRFKFVTEIAVYNTRYLACKKKMMMRCPMLRIFKVFFNVVKPLKTECE